jgi:hypothetical protein
MLNKIILYTAVVLILFWINACKAPEPNLPNTPLGNITLFINHKIDGQALQFDTMMYQNLASNTYSVTRLNYYLSNFELYQNGARVYTSNQIVYIDARQQPVSIQLENVPIGAYNQVSFLIGIDATNNQHGMIPNTDENIGMIWPEAMGGGYHFLKIEGQFLTPANDRKGYAIHTGLNECLIQHQPIVINISVNQTTSSTQNLTMNLNEWYKNPYSYNINTDGNYTMGDSTTMRLITNNGKDVFYAE